MFVFLMLLLMLLASSEFLEFCRLGNIINGVVSNVTGMVVVATVDDVINSVVAKI